jgi:VanZ family protein
MKFKYISWLPAILLMIVIFYFSSKPATVSEESSLRISHLLLNTYEEVADRTYEASVRLQVLSELDHIVRKTAHFMEYALLAVAWVVHFMFHKVRLRGRIGFPILLSSAFAVSDEFHQTFVAGRSGQVSDVVLDSCGAVTGALAMLLLVAVRKKFGNKGKDLKKQH